MQVLHLYLQCADSRPVTALSQFRSAHGQSRGHDQAVKIFTLRARLDIIGMAPLDKAAAVENRNLTSTTDNIRQHCVF